MTDTIETSEVNGTDIGVTPDIPKRPLPGSKAPEHNAAPTDSAPRGRRSAGRVRSKAANQAKSSGPAKAPTVLEPGHITKALTATYAQIGMGVRIFDQQIGDTILQSAETCAASLEALAKESPAVERALETLLTGSAIGGVIMAHMPIVLAIVNRGKPGASGTGNPPSGDNGVSGMSGHANPGSV